MSQSPKTCPSCNGEVLYTTTVSAGGGYAPELLPGLGSFFFNSAKFRVVLCQSCGHTSFFAEQAALEKVASSPKWQRL